MKLKLLIFLTGLSLVTSCNDSSKPNVELIQDMMESPALRPQEFEPDAKSHRASLVPPEGTIPQGFDPYLYSGDAQLAGKELKNPIKESSDMDQKFVGQKMYDTHCALCHGYKGEGGAENSIGKMMFLKPPTLIGDKIKGWTDGEIYHIITMGRGLMGPYASHVPQKYRWQLVNYIRHLQTQK